MTNKNTIYTTTITYVKLLDTYTPTLLENTVVSVLLNRVLGHIKSAKPSKRRVQKRFQPIVATDRTEEELEEVRLLLLYHRPNWNKPKYCRKNTYKEELRALSDAEFWSLAE